MDILISMTLVWLSHDAQMMIRLSAWSEQDPIRLLISILTGHSGLQQVWWLIYNKFSI